jgi:hypothetical protein
VTPNRSFQPTPFHSADQLRRWASNQAEMGVPVSVNSRAKNVPVLKDLTKEHRVPSLWRPALIEIVEALVERDYGVKRGVLGVEPVSDQTARHMESYIQDYGEELTSLPAETWTSSVCQWMDGHWEVLVDLWTRNEGRSDMVLSLRVSEHEAGYCYHIHMVYVP